MEYLSKDSCIQERSMMVYRNDPESHCFLERTGIFAHFPKQKIILCGYIVIKNIIFSRSHGAITNHIRDLFNPCFFSAPNGY
jgi:hypothetical protein